MAVCSLLHFLAGCPGWVLPTALPCGARTFLGDALALSGLRADATALSTHSLEKNPSGADGGAQIPDSPVRTRIAWLSGQMSTSSGAAERMTASSFSSSRTPLALETPPRRWEAPKP